MKKEEILQKYCQTSIPHLPCRQGAKPTLNRPSRPHKCQTHTKRTHLDPVMKTYRSQFPVASSSWIITVPSSWLWPKEMMSQTRSRQSFLLIEAEDTDNIGQYRLASSSKTKQTRNERPKSVFHGNQISAAFEIEYRANIEGAIDYAFFLKMSPCPYLGCFDRNTCKLPVWRPVVEGHFSCVI